jgi:hypothetical protein
MDDILFARVNLPLLDRTQAVNDILEIDRLNWFWDDYRATNMLPLMTKGSLSGSSGSSNNRGGNFEWLPYTPTSIRSWFDSVVFPWMGSKTRVMALMTYPGISNAEHIDSDISEIGTRQHKFRIVLQGQTSTLYFKTASGDVAVPNVTEPIIMDGSWPHGMTNDTNDVKITIAAGAPWCWLDNYNNVDVLMKKSMFDLPKDLTNFINTQRK